jgi:hypothetical protein
MSKAKDDPVNYVLTGSRYQVVNDKGETVNEFGVGMFRSGIRLQLAVDLYSKLVIKADSPSSADARRLAANAFSLTDVFLDEMDRDFHRTYPQSNNNSGRK